ncbi:MAG: DUF3108 domain-containing protein [Bacteroidales bacterium]
MNIFISRSYLIILLLCISFQGLQAQCFKENNAFRDGEYLSYQVAYNWGPIWVDAGLVTFSINSEPYRGKPAWHLKSSGRTYKSYDFFYKVVDYYDAWVDPESFRPFEFRRSVCEGGYRLLNTLRFDPKKETVYSSTKTNNNPVRFDTIRPTACVYNPLSAVYFARTLNISNLKPDERVPVTVLIDDSIYSIYIRYIGKEIVESRDGHDYRCVKFSAKMVKGTIFRGDEDVLVWVTDDENRIPVYIEAKILVGTVKAYLKDVKGVRNPLSSLLKIPK